MTKPSKVTDKDKFVALLKEFGIPFKENMFGENEITFGKDMYGEWEKSSKVDGYYGFFSQWHFDEDGKFVSTGAWE